jgi:hypothetical protein
VRAGVANGLANPDAPPLAYPVNAAAAAVGATLPAGLFARSAEEDIMGFGRPKGLGSANDEGRSPETEGDFARLAAPDAALLNGEAADANAVKALRFTGVESPFGEGGPEEDAPNGRFVVDSDLGGEDGAVWEPVGPLGEKKGCGLVWGAGDLALKRLDPFTAAKGDAVDA